MSRPDSAVFSAGPVLRTVRTADGRVLAVPDGWELLPPGDAALTRRVKDAGEFWAMVEPVGRKNVLLRQARVMVLERWG